MLLTKMPGTLFNYLNELFPALLKTLQDPDDQVVRLDLEGTRRSKASDGLGTSAIAGAHNSHVQCLRAFRSTNPTASTKVCELALAAPYCCFIALCTALARFQATSRWC